MKKIYNNWRSELLNEFAPSYGIEDEEGGIEQYITPSSDLVQKTVQDAIDASRGYHASGRPIDPNLLQSLLSENKAEDLISSMRDITDDYLRNLTLAPVAFENATGGLTAIRAIYQAATTSKGNTIYTTGPSLDRYLNSVFMDPVKFQEYKQNIQNATEAFGQLLSSKKYEIVHAIRLFTGESVSTVRDPSKFNPEMSNLMSGGRQRRDKMKFIKLLLPPLVITNEDSIRFRVPDIFESIINHIYLTQMPSMNDKLKTFTSPVFKKLFVQYFDKVVEIGKAKYTDPEMRIGALKKRQLEDMTRHIGFSTKSGRFQEFMKSIERLKSMLPIYQRFFKYYTDILGKPIKEDYERAKRILTRLANKPVKGNWQIYRGMYVKGDFFPTGLEKGMEFNFYDVSSWSTSRGTAKGFITPHDGKRAKGDMRLLFSMKPKRGTFIDKYSAFNGEDEFITGGEITVLRIEAMGDGLLVIECEQV